MEIIRNCGMGGYTSFKTGGCCEALLIPGSHRELAGALSKLSKAKSQYLVMGNGSNILVSDSGYPGVMIRIGEAFSRVEADGEELAAGAGALLSSVAAAAAEAGLSGLEFASGIPGSVGGAVFMNAGAYGSEMKDVVSRVNVISKDGEREFPLSPDEMKFAYRSSVLQDTGDIVTGAVFRLSKAYRGEIIERTRHLALSRSEKQPLSLPSAGSFFKRPPGHFAGKLIEGAGLMGLSVGGAMISTLHAGFIVNYDGATASDIIDLMRLVQLTVFDKFGVRLEPEVRILGELS